MIIVLQRNDIAIGHYNSQYTNDVLLQIYSKPFACTTIVEINVIQKKSENFHILYCNVPPDLSLIRIGQHYI